MGVNDYSKFRQAEGEGYIKEKQTANQSTRKDIPKADKNFGKSLIQIPGEFFPHAEFKEALWVVIVPKQLKGMNTAGRGGTLRIGKTGTAFKFLAPETIIEAHNHDWQEYESIQSKLLQKIVTYKTGFQQAKQIGKGAVKELYRLFEANAWPAGQQILDATINASSVGIPKFKVDTPLVYKASQRRNWNLTFILADASGGFKIMEAVKMLQKYAAPYSKQDVLSIEFPWVFELTTIPEGLIHAQFAALTSIQPSWMSPYIKGRPTRCELTLSFVDMSPLFEKTIETGGIVNVINSEGSNPAKPLLEQGQPQAEEAYQKPQREMKAKKAYQQPINKPQSNADVEAETPYVQTPAQKAETKKWHDAGFTGITFSDKRLKKKIQYL